ncbi:acyltransferase [Bradyrhizobium tropiciagri]|uniref:acyltransferase family protein n=1 Tax=Bradyrhizobium tropiciagri TaxID=312253 RepID=UPI001BAB7E55|nr:acyltransferase [Bradyrhizobium tropiciagri]MBR0868997.1 acyltransferase [Bradyrhizobium tropiciagri]
MKSQISTAPAGKFMGIEGLRGWLAWAVVFSHLTYISAFNAGGISQLLRAIGLPSVLVFTIVSGFVVTHVVIEKSEGYGPYLVRRFFRIFPLLAVTCFVGFFSSDLLGIALADPSFEDPAFGKVATDVAASDHSFLGLHLLAHLSMFHAAIPNSVLMHSEYAFNMPAWSISLEWQFYLLAPLIVFVLRDRREFLIPLAIVVAGSEVAFRMIGSGTAQPGALPQAATYFAVGIVSRLLYSRKFEAYRGPLLALAIMLLPFFQLWPFMIWLFVLCGLSNDGSDHVARAYRLGLENSAILYFGSRSYSIYLCHYPVISMMAWLLFRYSGQPVRMALLTCASVPLIIAFSELAHRLIEIPGIALGRYIAVGMHRSTLVSARRSWPARRTSVIDASAEPAFVEARKLSDASG